MTNSLYCGVTFKELYINHTGRFRNCCIQTQGYGEKGFLKSQNPNEWFAKQYDLNLVREDLQSGSRNPSCSKCWNLEDKGHSSYRMNWNRSTYYAGNTTPEIEIIDFRLGNQCNLQCRICNPMWSDQLGKSYQLAKDNGIFNSLNQSFTEGTIKPSSEVMEDLIGFCLRTPSLKEIKFAGGEPFVMPEVEYFLNRMIQKGKTNLTVSFLTNTTTAKESTIELLKQFKKVIMQCSIDGIGEDIEFQRFPCKWSVIERNFRKFVDCGFEVSLTPCWSQLNSLGVVNFLNWASEFDNVHVAYNEVTNPTYLDYKLIPLKHRTATIEAIKTCKFPKRMHKDYFKFFESLTTAERSITELERQSLADAAAIWDCDNNNTYRTRYGWAKELLE
jgi:organic radical activating enzyme